MFTRTCFFGICICDGGVLLSAVHIPLEACLGHGKGAERVQHSNAIVMWKKTRMQTIRSGGSRRGKTEDKNTTAVIKTRMEMAIQLFAVHARILPNRFAISPDQKNVCKHEENERRGGRGGRTKCRRDLALFCIYKASAVLQYQTIC